MAEGSEHIHRVAGAQVAEFLGALTHDREHEREHVAVHFTHAEGTGREPLRVLRIEVDELGGFGMAGDVGVTQGEAYHAVGEFLAFDHPCRTPRRDIRGRELAHAFSLVSGGCGDGWIGGWMD